MNRLPMQTLTPLRALRFITHSRLYTRSTGVRTARPVHHVARSAGVVGLRKVRLAQAGLALPGALAVLAYVNNSAKVVSCKADNLAHADDLFEHRGKHGNLSKCYTILLEEYEASPALRPQLCHRLARAAYNLIESADPIDQENRPTVKDLRDLTYKYALEAMELAPDDYQSAYWCGIGMSESNKNQAIKVQIENLMQMRAYFERAVELNPNDGTSQHCLGTWCYGLADLAWFKRKIVETVFSTPPHSSFEEALQYFLLAEEAEPGFWNKNVLMIAKSYAKMGDRANAKIWAEKTVARNCTTDEDERVKAEAEQLLRKL